MKRKVLFSIVGIALFAVAFAFSANENQGKNLKAENIEALANAGSGGFPGCCDNIWQVTYTIGNIKCTTGGSYKCPICCFPSLPNRRK
jgi:hypothetical protein